MKITFKPFLNILTVLALLSAALMSHFSYADCKRGGGLFDNKDVSVTTVSLPANIVITSGNHEAGDVLYTSGLVAGSNDKLTISGCGKGYVVGFFYNNSPQVEASAGTTTMPTNIPGIGVMVFAYNQAGPYDGSTTVDNSWHNGDGSRNDHTLRNSSYMIWLVATGEPISSGTLTFGSPVAQVDFRESASHSANGDVASQLSLSNANVVLKATGCTADVSGISFAFGTLDASIFDTKGKVPAPSTQDVNLSCEAGTNVSMSVAAAESLDGDVLHTIIALTGTGTEGVAKGVGVQLGLKTSSYDSGSNGIPLNQDIPLMTSARNNGSITFGGAASQEKLTFSAAYYKTGITVKPGKANATATITLTYN